MLALNSKSDLNHTIITLWSNIRNSDIQQMSYGPVAYDTAYLGKIKQNRKPMFPQAIKWLEKNQMSDGSWGSNANIYFDQVLSTVATTNTLLEYNDADNTNIQSALKWIQNNIARIFEMDQTKTGVGFGILLPPLLYQLQNKIEYDLSVDKLYDLWIKKIEQLPYKQILREHTHLAWNLEFLETLEVNQNLLARQIISDGSIVCSNAATAYYVLQNGKYRDWSLNYLKSEYRPDGSISQFAPIDTYNLIWTLHPIVKALGFVPEHFKKDLIKMKSRLRPDGITMGESFPFTDSDDTSLLMFLLEKSNLIGQKNSFLKFINHYEGNTEWYENYTMAFGKSTSRSLSTNEKNRFAISANLHIYEAFTNFEKSNIANIVIDKLDHSFSKYFSENTALPHDRWHISPLYNNAHAIYAFGNLRPEWSQQCLNYLLDSLLPTGHFTDHLESRTELNSIATAGILHYHNNVEKIDIDILQPAIDWIIKNPEPKSALWIAKTLNKPEFLQAIVLSSLLEYKKAKYDTDFSFLQ